MIHATSKSIRYSWKSMRNLKDACLSCKHFAAETDPKLMVYRFMGVCMLFCEKNNLWGFDPDAGVVGKWTKAPPCATWSYEKDEILATP